MVTVALVTRAPDGSETVPERDAVELSDWDTKATGVRNPVNRVSSRIENLGKHTAFTSASFRACKLRNRSRCGSSGMQARETDISGEMMSPISNYCADARKR